MKCSAKYSVVAVLVCCCVGTSLAAERAATPDLPAALSAVGVDEAQFLTADEAHLVRGQGIPHKAFVPFLQVKKFVIKDGKAWGETTLLEGVMGKFKYHGQDLHAHGTFGGLEGKIGVHDGNLTFAFQGKALRETFRFHGKFHQVFVQHFKKH